MAAWKSLGKGTHLSYGQSSTDYTLNSPPPAPAARRFLLMSALEAPVSVWIDDEGTCDVRANRDGIGETPVCRGGRHHLYQQDGRNWAMICPHSLSKDEQGRTFYDSPPGSARVAVQQYRDFLRSQKPSRRQEFGDAVE